MSIWTTTATRITRTWVSTYTAGLAANDREARVAEISSDLWEHQHDAASEGTRLPAIALSIFGRMLRGIPADVFWRTNVEGPQMDIRIPIERITGGILLGMVVLLMITAGISGIDTRATEFESYFVDFAYNSSLVNTGNGFFRIATGFSLIAGAACLYATLRERAPVLATIVGFAMLVAAALELVATGLQIVLVGLSDEYVAAPADQKAVLLANARSIALIVEMAIGLAVLTLLGSIYALALLTTRERLVPRWLIGLPILSAGAVGGALFMEAAGAGDTGPWLAMLGGGLLGVIWLLIAGLWLIFTPKQEAASSSLSASAT